MQIYLVYQTANIVITHLPWKQTFYSIKKQKYFQSTVDYLF